MSTKVISVRIRKEIVEELEKHGINVNDEVRKAIEELYKGMKKREYLELWRETLQRVEPSEEGFSVRSVRQDRDSH
ncbi:MULTISPECIES: VapB-type antitoxin [Metallosphaera]|uniref:type II toxin-antitoxin system VapB family antitoxin n=1 Tax=Metallosphaera TaxID=41980 RepID=UPI001EDD9B1B|nr:VapB-type antitoxin [Metallosphaera javensis (ex Hofmann et al. 2022)]